MVTLCVAALKGGVGKTTTATTLAYLLSEEHEKRVLLIDADCQGNASAVYGVYDPEGIGMANLMLYPLEHMGESADMSDYILSTEYGVDVIPANAYLMQANGRLIMEKEFNQVNIIKNALHAVSEKYDYCIIDCGLQMDLTVVNAIVAADYVLSPTKIGGYELDAAEELGNQLTDLGVINPNVSLISIITMFQNNKSNRIIEENIRDRYLDYVLDHHVRNSSVVTKKSFCKGPLPVNSKNSIAVKDYRAALDELLEVI